MIGQTDFCGHIGLAVIGHIELWADFELTVK